MRKKWHPFFLLFLSLASFGLIYQLITEPLKLFFSLLILIIVILIFVAIYRYMIKKPSVKIKKSAAQKKKKKDHPFKVIKGGKR